jgi:hypothetical protein
LKILKTKILKLRMRITYIPFHEKVALPAQESDNLEVRLPMEIDGNKFIKDRRIRSGTRVFVF